MARSRAGRGQKRIAKLVRPLRSLRAAGNLLVSSVGQVEVIYLVVSFIVDGVAARLSLHTSWIDMCLNDVV